jgi:acyl carrier protein
MERSDILEIVLKQVNSLVDTLPEDQKFDVTGSTILFGKDSNIDSLSLVSLIVDLEAYFLDEHNLEISLTDDRAMTREISPFNNVTSLTDYLVEIVNEK